ncbi:hypothetical protein O3P69_013109 [Scylla paramamosain]|uniref:Uncharacterized protein n=1 Tax=Scylla paramamosain TaxID=85552 RepID=A0AAW0U0K4_SCYPA
MDIGSPVSARRLNGHTCTNNSWKYKLEWRKAKRDPRRSCLEQINEFFRDLFDTEGVCAQGPVGICECGDQRDQGTCLLTDPGLAAWPFTPPWLQLLHSTETFVHRRCIETQIVHDSRKQSPAPLLEAQYAMKNPEPGAFSPTMPTTTNATTAVTANMIISPHCLGERMFYPLLLRMEEQN